MNEPKIQAETKLKEGYKRSILIPIIIASVIMFFIRDLDSVVIPIIYGPLSFADITPLQYLTQEGRTDVGQLMFALFCTAYICTCIMAICSKNQQNPRDPHQSKTEDDVRFVSIFTLLSELTLREIVIFFGRSFAGFMLTAFWMLATPSAVSDTKN
jgi:hypothetical protein